MARKQFVVLYPDHSKSNISRSERDRLLLSQLISPAGDKVYRYVGQAFTVNNFADMGRLSPHIFRTLPDTGFLPGRYIIDYGDRKVTDIQARPGQMELQLRQQGLIA